MPNLNQFYYGKWWEGKEEASEFRITAMSRELPEVEAKKLQQVANIGRHTRKNLNSLKHGYGLFNPNVEIFLLVHVRPSLNIARGLDNENQRGFYIIPEARYIVIPKKDMTNLRGNLQPLFQLFDGNPHLPAIPKGGKVLDPVLLNDPKPLAKEVEQSLLAPAFELRSKVIEQLLTAIIEGKPVAIVNTTYETKQRWDFCQAILLTLPPTFRHHVTFATEVFESQSCPALLKFLYQDSRVGKGKDDIKLSLTNQTISADLLPHPYAKFIAERWAKGAASLVNTLHSDGVSKVATLYQDASLSEALATLTKDLVWNEKIITKQIASKDLPAIKEWLVDKLDLAATNPALLNSVQANLHQLTQLGFGREMYQLGDKWLQQNQKSSLLSFLDELAFAYFDLIREGQSVSENELLPFVGQVRQRNKDKNALLEELEPLASSYPQLARPVIEMYFELKKNPVEFMTSSDQCEPRLQRLVQHLQQPNRNQHYESGLLVAISQQISRNYQTQLLGLLVHEVLNRKAAYLLDEQTWKALQPQIDISQLNLRPHLEQLNKTVLVDWIEHQASNDLSASFAGLNALQKQYPKGDDIANAIYNLAQRILNEEAFLRRLRGAGFGQNIEVTAYLGLLQRANQRYNTSELAIQATNAIVGLSSGWNDKAAKLAELLQTNALQKDIQTKQTIETKLYEHALEVRAEELEKMSKDFDRHPELSSTGVQGLNLFEQILGNRRVDGLNARFENAAQILQALKTLSRRSKQDLEQTLMPILQRASSSELKMFYDNCTTMTNILSKTEASSSYTPSHIDVQMAAKAFTRLLRSFDKPVQPVKPVQPMQSSAPPLPEQFTSEAAPNWTIIGVSVVALILGMISVTVGWWSEGIRNIVFGFMPVVAVVTLIAVSAYSVRELMHPPSQNGDIVERSFALQTVGVVLYLALLLLGMGLAQYDEYGMMLTIMNGLGFVFLLWAIASQLWRRVLLEGQGKMIQAIATWIALLATCLAGMLIVTFADSSSETEASVPVEPTLAKQNNAPPAANQESTPIKFNPIMTETLTATAISNPIPTQTSTAITNTVIPSPTSQTTSAQEAASVTSTPQAETNSTNEAVESQREEGLVDMAPQTPIRQLEANARVYFDESLQQELLVVKNSFTVTLLNSTEISEQVEMKVWVAGTTKEGEVLAQVNGSQLDITTDEPINFRDAPGLQSNVTILAQFTPLSNQQFSIIETSQPIDEITWYQISIIGYVKP